jgi:hypothetical protein
VTEDEVEDPDDAPLPGSALRTVEESLGTAKDRAAFELVRISTDKLVPSNYGGRAEMSLVGARDLTEVETAAVLTEVFDLAERDTEAYRPHRAWAFWRTLRYDLARRGIIYRGEPLSAALQRTGFSVLSSRDSYSQRHMAGLPGAAWQLLRGLPIHPAFTDDPSEKDRIVCGHLIIAEHLEISRGTVRDPRWGLHALNDIRSAVPGSASRLFPSVQELEAFETEAVDRVLNLQLKKSGLVAKQWAKKRLGLTEPEIQELMKIADTVACSRAARTPQERQAIMSLRLEDIYGRARKSLNTDLEIKVLNLMNKVDNSNSVKTIDDEDFGALASEPIKTAEVREIHD